jgi:sulfate transport system ATP-binding protein
MNHGRIEQIGTPDAVYSSPASPFVYQFLGNVNVFHSRVHGEWAEVGTAGEGGVAFVRPHEIDIEHAPVAGGLEALIQDVHAIGPTVRVELLHGKEVVEVELTRERAESLGVANGQRVWLKPRQMKVFAASEHPLEEGGSGI